MICIITGAVTSSLCVAQGDSTDHWHSEVLYNGGGLGVSYPEYTASSLALNATITQSHSFSGPLLIRWTNNFQQVCCKFYF